MRYDVVKEADGTIVNQRFVTDNGSHPYAIALEDKFVLAWIDYYNDRYGKPKIAIIDLSDFEPDPTYGLPLLVKTTILTSIQ